MKLTADLSVEKDILEILGNISKIGYWSYDVQSGEIFWSSTTRKIHDVDEDFIPTLEVVFNAFKEGESRDKLGQAVAHAQETGEPYDLRLEMISEKGVERWVRATGRVEKDGDTVLKMYGTIQDISKSMKQKETLQGLVDRLFCGL